jgi:AdoMet-dependent heme synthase
LECLLPCPYGTWKAERPIFAKVYNLSKTVSFDIKTTEAQHYRRFVLQQRVAQRRSGLETTSGHERSVDAIGRAPSGLNDGKGFVFISHKGEVFPSGFLPLSAGNIRAQELVAIYRDSPLFRDLRDTSKLEGKCGCCEFKEICGGSHARAFALTGNPYAEESCCCYVPKGYVRSVSQIKTATTLHVLQGA